MVMLKNVRYLFTVLMLCLILVLTACSSTSGTTPPPTVTHGATPLSTPTANVKTLSTPILTYSGHQYLGVIDAEWSPDGKRIVSASQDKTVQIWDAATGQTLLTYRGHKNPVFAVAWSPDGKRIASATGNINYEQGPESVQIWDATIGQTLMNYTVESVDGFADGVFSVSWSPAGPSSSPGHGSRLAFAGADYTADIVDVATGHLLLIYHGHTKVVWSVAWSPDGKYVVSGGQDTTAQVWVP